MPQTSAEVGERLMTSDGMRVRVALVLVTVMVMALVMAPVMVPIQMTPRRSLCGTQRCRQGL